MEYWDILDKNRNFTGKTLLRGMEMSEDEYHLVVDVWIKNSLGEYYITKRTPNKTFPNQWTTTGGSATSGDSSLVAALREVEEEIGIKLKTKGRCIKSFRRDTSTIRAFKDIWLFHEDFDESLVKHQVNEVSDAKWVTEADIRQMIKDGEFIDVLTYLDELFKEEE